MDLEKLWQKALSKTEIHRARLSHLHTFGPTELPYVLLTESSVNTGDTVVRKGKVKVDKPLIILPQHYPLFEGFEFDKDLHLDSDMIRSFLLMRGVALPSLRYSNLPYSIDLHEESLKNTIEHYKDLLEKKEDIRRGLIIGLDDAWQLSLLIYVVAMVSKSADNDITKFFEKFKEEGFNET